LAILVFNLFEEVAQGGFVRRVPGKDFAGQGKALRGHHQGDDYLHTVRTFIPRLTKTLLGVPVIRLIDFERGARQVVEQHFKSCPEKVLPLIGEVVEEFAHVLQYPVVHPLERVLFHQCIVVAEELPFTARSDKKIANQGL
jgi:hypothetical protein